MDEYYTVKSECSAEITEKKSRFIATIRHVSSEAEALDFIQEMKKKYWDARHNCPAYVISERIKTEEKDKAAFKDTEKCNDDGEPSKTAGSPILETIKGAGLKNVAIVVTRYFGGVLLGTGGLVRAYSQAAASCIEAAEKVKMQLFNKVELVTDYTSYGKFSYLAGEEKAVITDTCYTENVLCTFLCDDIALGRIGNRMAEITSGKASLKVIDKDFYTVEI